MFLNITPDNWAQLWGGLLGSIPSSIVAAAVAAWVAVFVLERSNTEQRKRDKKLLDEQRAGLEKQLRAQEQEASKSRERVAISEAISGFEELLHVVGDDEALGPIMTRFGTAVTRWGFEIDDELWEYELGRWPYLLYCLVTERREELHDGKIETDTRRRLQTAGVKFSLTAQNWPRASEEKREAYIEELTKLRESTPFKPAGSKG